MLGAKGKSGGQRNVSPRWGINRKYTVPCHVEQSVTGMAETVPIYFRCLGHTRSSDVSSSPSPLGWGRYLVLANGP